nr:MAG TPA: hypothetical protein [Caudoviricetes sp.]
MVSTIFSAGNIIIYLNSLHISYMDDAWVILFAYLYCILINLTGIVASNRYSSSL